MTMIDKDLFGRPQPIGAVRHTDPDTSQRAAELVPVTKLQWMYLKALINGPQTTTEIAERYQMDRDTFSPRSKALEQLGLIERAGKRLCANSSGRRREMLAFRLTALGRSRLATSRNGDPL